MTVKDTQISSYKTLPKSRKEAIAQGEMYFFTGIPCRRGHLTKNYTTSGRCAMCSREDTDATLEKFKIAKMNRKKNNSEHLTVG